MNEDGTKARGIIAICIAILLGAALAGSFLLNPSQSQQANVNLIIGGLLTSMATVVGFYFGSSSGSKVLTANQQEIARAAITAVTSTGTGNGALANATPAGTPSDPVSVTEASAPTYDPGDAVPTKLASVDIPFPPEPEDSNLTRFRVQFKAMQPRATEEQVLAAFRVMYPSA